MPAEFIIGDPNGPKPVAAALTAAVVTAAAMSLLYLVLADLVDRQMALISTLVVAVASPTWSVSADALWTHGPAQLVLVGAMLGMSRQRYLIAGLCLGAAVVVRPHLAVAGAAAIGYLFVKHRLRLAALLTPGVAAGCVALLTYNYRVFGSISPLGGYASNAAKDGISEGPVMFVVNVIGALVSPGMGVLVLTPMLWILIPGLRQALRVSPEWVKASALAGTAYAVAQLYLVQFSGGTAFYSYRTMIEPLMLATPPFGSRLSRMGQSDSRAPDMVRCLGHGVACPPCLRGGA